MNIAVKAKIDVLMAVQDCVCGLCEGAKGPIPANLRGRDRFFHPLRATIDHVYPTRYGGDFGWGNIIVAHSVCNNDKGSLPPTERQVAFLEAVNSRIPHLLERAA